MYSLHNPFSACRLGGRSCAAPQPAELLFDAQVPLIQPAQPLLALVDVPQPALHLIQPDLHAQQRLAHVDPVPAPAHATCAVDSNHSGHSKGSSLRGIGLGETSYRCAGLSMPSASCGRMSSNLPRYSLKRLCWPLRLHASIATAHAGSVAINFSSLSRATFGFTGCVSAFVEHLGISVRRTVGQRSSCRRCGSGGSLQATVASMAQGEIGNDRQSSHARGRLGWYSTNAETRTPRGQKSVRRTLIPAPSQETQLRATAWNSRIAVSGHQSLSL